MLHGRTDLHVVKFFAPETADKVSAREWDYSEAVGGMQLPVRHPNYLGYSQKYGPFWFWIAFRHLLFRVIRTKPYF